MAEQSDSAFASRAPGDAAVLGAAASDPALRADLRRYLDRQSELAALQIEEAKREDSVRHWGLRVRHISDVLKLGLELAVAFIVVAIALGLAVAIWQAAHADGLVIESFDVPNDMAVHGISGQVVASKLLDHLTVMQNGTDSIRAASSFANDWTNDIKVEIPDTGVSLGQVVRFLRGWLGHETHLSGEVYETPSGIALTVRMDNAPGRTFEGKPGDLDAILARAAEAVYARAQPYRYGVYLADQGRFAESMATLQALAAAGPPNETAWADLGLTIVRINRGDPDAARASVAAGKQANPNLPNSDMSLGVLESDLGHDQASLDDLRRGDALLKRYGAQEWNPAQIPTALQADQSNDAQSTGDFAQAFAKNIRTNGGGGDEGVGVNSFADAVSMHDVALAHRFLAALDDMAADPNPRNLAPADAAAAHGLLLIEAQDWSGALAQFEAAAYARRKIETASKGWLSAKYFLGTSVLPYEAYAFAMLGEFDRADAILKTLPDDCDICARMHGKVEAARHNWTAAARWFALVAARSPGIPFADADWGRMLLQKGDLDGAIAKFASANKKGPHFADPLEMWGEALIRQNRSDLALAKFAEAKKYAPNWGRLHLKWGEALFYAGQRDEARKQFAIAAQLELSASEKTALARMNAAHE